MDLSQFIKECCSHICESVHIRDLDKAKSLISSYLQKRKIYTLPIVSTCMVDNKKGFYIEVFNESGQAACFYWTAAETSQIAGVGFVKDMNRFNVAMINPKSKYDWDVYVESKGTNIVQMCKLVEKVLTGKVPMESTAIRSEIIDSQLFESKIEENEEEVIEEELIEEGNVDPYIAELKRKKFNLYQRLHSARKKGKDTEQLEIEYQKLSKELTEARLAIRSGVTVQSSPDPDVEKEEENFFEEIRATPEERFDDMKNYIYNVIMGIRPLALLCGAPGVGKTFRVMQAVKGTGKQQGIDYKLLKGKSTPTNLYTSLHDFKNPGQLIIMDDCDSVFKDPDMINLLKAAFDSSDERWVTWGTAVAIPMSSDLAEECDDAVYDDAKNKWYYPKEFLYEGGGIIITNYSAGQIDTAIRNRALICDLNFTVQEILGLIRNIAPKIMPGIIPDAAKEKALDYLQELADQKAPVELSIRSFQLCAGLYASNCPERQVQRMINEQMRLQSMRGGKKY